MWFHFLVAPQWGFAQTNPYSSYYKHFGCCFATLLLQQSIKIKMDPEVQILTSWLQLPMESVCDLTHWTQGPDDTCSFLLTALQGQWPLSEWQDRNSGFITSWTAAVRSEGVHLSQPEACFHFHSSLAVQQYQGIETEAVCPVTGTKE